MKYALSILTTLIFVLSTHSASARTIHSFRQSDALQAVAQFMYDVAEDIPVGARISDKKIKITDFSKCTEVSAQEVQHDFEMTVKRVLRYYPDEDVPFDQAIADMEDYLDHQTYKKCTFERKAAQSNTRSVYYADLSDKIHLRVDNIALTAE